MESRKEKIRNARYRAIAFVVAVAIHLGMYMFVQQMMATDGQDGSTTEVVAADLSE